MRSSTSATRPGPASSEGELTVGRLFGIPLRLHWTFFLLAVWLAMDGLGYGVRGLIGTAGWLALVFGSVLVHELAHALVGSKVGAGVEDIVLLPVGGATRLNRPPEGTGARLVMTAAGPLTSLGLAAFFALLAVAAESPLLPVDLHHGNLTSRIFWLNIILGLFNLLPVFPMDGGRLLQAVFERRLGARRATVLAARTGQVMAVVMAIIGLIGNLWLALIAIYLFLQAGSEAKGAALLDTSSGSRLSREAQVGGDI